MISSSGGFMSENNEPSGSVKGGNSLDYQSDFKLLKEDLASCSQFIGKSVNF
jgi:hypothetical protein